MDDAEFAKRVRKEIDEEINPFYVAELLKKGIPNLLRWLQENNLGAMEQMAHEALFWAEVCAEREDEEGRRTLRLGVRMLEGRCKLGLFILKEIKRRLETVDASLQPVSELPVGEDNQEE